MIIMSEKINEKEIWENIGYIKISPTRYKILKTIEGEFVMPSEIAKSTGLRITQVSNALLVYCMNEEASKGRLYQNTELGLEVLRRIEQNKK